MITCDMPSTGLTSPGGTVGRLSDSGDCSGISRVGSNVWIIKLGLFPRYVCISDAIPLCSRLARLSGNDVELCE